MTDPGRFVFEPRISLVTLAVRDLHGVANFYEALGWRRSATGGDEVAFFQLGPLVLAIWTREELAADASIPAEGSGFRGVSLAYNVRSGADVDAALAAAAAAGGRVTQPAHDAVWGGRTGYFADPDGNLWEVAWNPGFALDGDGGVHLPPEPAV